MKSSLPVTTSDNLSAEPGVLLHERERSSSLAGSALRERTGRINFNSGDLPNLDFLRACAVLFVLGSHLLIYFQITIPHPVTPYGIGRWGVLIFFVHTTLVLFFSLERHSCHVSKSRLFWSFLIRRTFRILPLSVFVVCVLELFRVPGRLLMSGHFVPVQLNLSGFISNIFLVQNITHTGSATGPLWSLPYEMQMYLVLPALFMIVRNIGVLLPISCFWLAGILAMQHDSWFARHQSVPDFMLYVPYFLPGIIAYKWMLFSKIRLPSIIWPIALAGITACYLWDPSAFRGAACCLMLGLTIPHFAQLTQAGVVKVAQLIARYSYGIYLTHFPCIWFAFQALGGLPRVEQWTVFLILLLLVPVTLYHMIEDPMIRVGRRLVSRLC